MNGIDRIRRFAGAALLTLAGLGGMGLALPAAAQSDWTFCSDEGETCHVGSHAIVRFGTPGRWAHKQVNGEVRCDTRTFGDPSPQRRKSCEVARDWRDPGEQHDGNWRYCSREGQDCVVNGNARVRFGANGSYNTRQASGRIECSTKRFGDPAPNVFKTCQVEQRGWGGGGGGWGGGNGGGQGGHWGGGGGGDREWRRCASEGETCMLPGQNQVRFGTNGRYAYRDADGAIRCSTGNFGDPAPQQRKQCDYRVTGNSGGGSGRGWEFCADENRLCNVAGTNTVRFGADGRYRTITRNGPVVCKENYFGGDPYPGRVKRCEVRR